MSETIIKDALDRLEKITDIDFLLSEEEKMIRDMVRKFVEVEILPDAARHFEEGTFPLDKARRLCLWVGRLKDKGNATHTHISLAKRNNVWMARECARMAAYGGSGKCLHIRRYSRYSYINIGRIFNRHPGV